MLTISIDLIGAWLLARWVRRLWLAIVLSIPVGVIAALLGAAVLYWYLNLLPGQAGSVFAQGTLVHPIVTIVAVVVVRKLARVRPKQKQISQARAAGDS